MKATLFSIALLTAGILLASGCESKRSGSTPPKVAEAEPKECGEWCDEHGILEAECSKCSMKAKDDFKKKGDWCKKHNIADSQCFICHPEKEAEAAEQYKALYGKEMPKPTGNTANP